MRSLFVLTALTILVAAMLAGCSTRGVYEGIQQQEAVRDPSPYGQSPRRPTYDEYESERRKTGATPDAR